MFSPHDRIYNSPDLSVPATEAILQQIRLERILKRFGYLACCKQNDPSAHNGIAPPVVSLPPPSPPRVLRPFGAHEAFTGWQHSNNIIIPKPRICTRVQKSGIPGAPVNDPYLQHQKETIGGCKYGGVHLSKYGLQDEVMRADIFKPFQPLKSPQRLPAIQRDRKELVPKLPPPNVYMHTKETKKKKRDFKKQQAKQGKTMKKKRKKEMEFMKWEASQDQYFDKSVTDLHDYVNTRGTTVHAGANKEQQVYRNQIATQIKQGVQDRIDSFGQSGKMLASTTRLQHIPVLEMQFEHDNVQTNHVYMK
jgi:hypothetical protein